MVADAATIREIIDCLTPSEPSDTFVGLMRGVIHRVGFHGPRGITWVEFIDTGKNPLFFRVNGKTYVRGGHMYLGYQSDHRRLYGIDSHAIDESMAFYHKLEQICSSDKSGKVGNKSGTANGEAEEIQER